MFRDRTDAGRRLANALKAYRGMPVVVYALPRGGVVLGVEVARELEAPLDLIVVRKIGHPMQSEYAIGAVTEEGDVALNPDEARTIHPEWLAEATRTELREAQRRRALFLRDRAQIPVQGKVAIIVDDGLATGLTMEAALRLLRKRHPAKVVVAVPVAAIETVRRFSSQADEIISLITPKDFGAVGVFYRNFDQVTDEEVVGLLSKTAKS